MTWPRPFLSICFPVFRLLTCHTHPPLKSHVEGRTLIASSSKVASHSETFFRVRTRHHAADVSFIHGHPSTSLSPFLKTSFITPSPRTFCVYRKNPLIVNCFLETRYAPTTLPCFRTMYNRTRPKLLFITPQLSYSMQLPLIPTPTPTSHTLQPKKKKTKKQKKIKKKRKKNSKDKSYASLAATFTKPSHLQEPLSARS